MSPWTIELASDVCPEAVAWLWLCYLARGKLAMLDGDPDMGKSLITIDLVARLSRGGPLPDGAPSPRPCTSIILSAEDGTNDTVRPRLGAAGADLSRVVLPKSNGRGPRFPDDLPALEELVRACSADLVVIDPVMAFLSPKVAANLDQCVRQALTPMAELAERSACAILLVRHLTKQWRARAIFRGQGSVGIVGVARTGLLVAPHPPFPRGGVLTVQKNNLGPRPPALGYRVVGAAGDPGAIEWAGPVGVTADAAGRAEPAGGVRPRERAVDWLKRELAGGPRKSADLYAAAAATGIPERTLERAKEELRATSHRHYDYATCRGEWYWYDPDSDWPSTAPFRKPRELAPLPPL